MQTWYRSWRVNLHSLRLRVHTRNLWRDSRIFWCQNIINATWGLRLFYTIKLDSIILLQELRSCYRSWRVNLHSLRLREHTLPESSP